MPAFVYSMFAKIPVFFAATGDPCDPNEGSNPFFGIPTWYKYLNGVEDENGRCVVSVNFDNGLEPLWGIALAVAEMLLVIAALMAIIYIVFAGYVFVRSAGSPDKTAAARNKLTSAIAGLIIVIIATSVVRFIGSSLGG